MTTINTDKLKLKSRTTDIVSTFIKKTYELLEDQRFPEIVDWNSEGTALVIKKPTEFAQKVLPTYFKHNNLTSFVRQLNMYDFHKRRTQKYDHVYYHDLFQKDKKHLLKEIKRKNQDNTLASIQKAIETLESVQSGSKNESITNTYENQLLKKLNKDALARISSLESKVKDLTIQNQALWNQITHQNQKEDLMVSFLANFMKEKGITLDQLPNVLSNQFNLPHMDVNSHAKVEAFDKHNNSIYKSSKPVNVGDFLNFGEESCNSTELSPSSPLSKGTSENDRSFIEPTPTSLDCFPDIKTKLQESMANNDNSMFSNIEPKNFEQNDWNLESNYLNSLGDTNNKVSNGGNEVLGKRSLNREDSMQLIDKLVKKNSFVMPQDYNPFNGSEARDPKEELDSIKIRKLDSFNDIFPSIDQMQNHIDLMDFDRY